MATTALESLIRNLSTALDNTQTGSQLVTEATVDLLQNDDTMTMDDALIRQLEENVSAYIDMGLELSTKRDVLETLLASVRAGEEGVDDLCAVYERECGERLEAMNPEEEYRTHPLMRQFRDKIKEACPDKKRSKMDEDEEDDDMVMVSQRETFTCPLSQCVMTKPVRNVACGHVFDEAAIQAFLRGRSVSECPIPGCRHQVSRNGLQLDRSLARRIQREQMQQEQ